jgi:hypothetical protein
MGLCSFLSALFADGRVRVADVDSPLDDEFGDAEQLLVDFEREYRDDLPGNPPPISLPAARYGACTLYRACQFLVYRDVDQPAIRQVLGRELDQPRCPSVDYSVDVTLRMLPDAVRLARAAASGDPLVEELVRLANQWPLSSVGIQEAGVGSIDTFAEDPCLLRLYVDRVIARRDVKRLADDRARAVAAQAIGAFDELAPGVATALVETGAAPDKRNAN